MRLLHTTKLEIQTFLGAVPPYAILSHTWGEGEVTFQDFTSEERTKRKGWPKVDHCCRLAARDGWSWVWIDTCCIDKSDSSELSEAINSMFRWYEEAQTCYAYLEDVPTRVFVDPERLAEMESIEEGFPWRWHFRSSRWFTRGWTLQELLAPSFLVFVDSGWGKIGSREAWADEICAASGLEPKHLIGFRDCSLATKLSWAVKRKTTREEDRAYSLLGLLGVNMPLIYGEGKKAFMRLQQELIRSYNDESIFAWGTSGHDRAHVQFRETGFLANSLDEFSGSGDLVCWAFDAERRGFALSNMGLALNAEVFEGLTDSGRSLSPPLFSIQLNCAWAWHTRKRPVQLLLRRTGAGFIFCRASKSVRPWRDLSVASIWYSLGRRDIVIENMDEKHSPDVAIVVKVALEDGTPVRDPIEEEYYFLDQAARRWKPFVRKLGGSGTGAAWTMQEEYVLRVDDSEVLFGSGGGLLSSFWAVMDSDEGDIPHDDYPFVLNSFHHWPYLPPPGAKRFGLIIKMASNFPIFGIWPLEPHAELTSLSRYFDREDPYPHTAPVVEDFVIRIECEPEMPPDARYSHKLRRAVDNLRLAVDRMGKKLFVASDYSISIAKSFSLRIRRDVAQEQHYQVQGLGTVIGSVPCPLIKWAPPLPQEKPSDTRAEKTKPSQSYHARPPRQPPPQPRPGDPVTASHVRRPEVRRNWSEEN